MIDFVPFILGSAHTIGPLLARAPDGTQFIDVFDASQLPFGRLLHVANSISYGGMGMPEWVQLDLCTLPTAMIGLALPRAALDSMLYRRLIEGGRERWGDEWARRLDAWDGLVPVAQCCAARTPEAHTVLSFSLWSLLPGMGLARRAKALALLCHGARRQLGVAQYGNPSLRTHVRFGPLAVLEARAPAHSRPDDSFLYAVALPDAPALAALASASPPPRPTIMADKIELPVDDAIAARVEALGARGQVSIVAPGLVGDAGALRLVVATSSPSSSQT